MCFLDILPDLILPNGLGFLNLEIYIAHLSSSSNLKSIESTQFLNISCPTFISG